MCHAQKCSNANNCWHFNIYKNVGILTFMSMINRASEGLKARKVFIFQRFSFYEA